MGGSHGAPFKMKGSGFYGLGNSSPAKAKSPAKGGEVELPGNILPEVNVSSKATNKEFVQDPQKGSSRSDFQTEHYALRGKKKKTGLSSSEEKQLEVYDVATSKAFKTSGLQN